MVSLGDGEHFRDVVEIRKPRLAERHWQRPITLMVRRRLLLQSQQPGSKGFIHNDPELLPPAPTNLLELGADILIEGESRSHASKRRRVMI